MRLEQQNALLPKKSRKKVIGKKEVEKIIARIARIPDVQVGKSDKVMLKKS